jgi:hypothetical protein
VTSRGEVIAEIAGPKAAEEEAESIRKRLRGLLTSYQAPAESAHSAEEWAINR